jgi:sporulation protein YabP
MEEKAVGRMQNLYLKNREEISVDCVENIISFDGSEITLNTSLGTLVIEGEGLKVENLSKSDGRILITGEIMGIYYTNTHEKQNKGVFKRIFK